MLQRGDRSLYCKDLSWRVKSKNMDCTICPGQEFAPGNEMTTVAASRRSWARKDRGEKQGGSADGWKGALTTDRLMAKKTEMDVEREESLRVLRGVGMVAQNGDHSSNPAKKGRARVRAKGNIRKLRNTSVDATGARCKRCGFPPYGPRRLPSTRGAVDSGAIRGARKGELNETGLPATIA